MRGEAEVNRAVDRYGDTIQRICMIHLKNHADTQDIFQEVFLKYALSTAVFENERQEKAWLIRVAVNACRDLLKSFFRSRVLSVDEVLMEQAVQPTETREVLAAVLSLPGKYRDALYLHYYEGYTAREIGTILGKKENTVYTLLARGRNLLREALGGDGNEGSN